MEGVCRPQSDDCTALCVPAEQNVGKKKVCSKGCNLLFKTELNKEKATDAERFGILVCQANKQVSCKPASATSNKTTCDVDKQVTAVALCKRYSVDLWNMGPTCIAHATQRKKHPHCSGKIIPSPDLLA